MRAPVLVVLVMLLNALVYDVSTSPVKGVSPSKGKDQQKDQQIQTTATPQQPKDSTSLVKDVSPGKGKDQQKDQLSEDDVPATTAHTTLNETTPESTEHRREADGADGQGDGDGQAEGDDGLGEDDSNDQGETNSQGDGSEESDGQSSEDSDGQSSEDSDGQSSEEGETN
ncbi:uncharacterized protein DDB_G0290685-like [Engraulis encrasicolus]|uniref:uncharacterized protein DDB_G0290685-like n=1 Tax=Engraulis encrasicolus TaxID=184585 RepID=UPI002FD4AE26